MKKKTILIIIKQTLSLSGVLDIRIKNIYCLGRADIKKKDRKQAAAWFEKKNLKLT